MSIEHLTPAEQPADHIDIHIQTSLIAGSGCKLSTFASLLYHRESILHVGTALAEAGDEITSIRGDAHWINLDPSYETHAERYNYEFIQAGIDELDDRFAEEEFSRIYCYGLIEPDTEKAEEIMRKLYKYLKPGGRIKVGPISEKDWHVTRSLASRMREYVKPPITGAPPKKQPYQPTAEEKKPLAIKKGNPYLEAVRKNLEALKSLGSVAVERSSNILGI